MIRMLLAAVVIAAATLATLAVTAGQALASTGASVKSGNSGMGMMVIVLVGLFAVTNCGGGSGASASGGR